jgi:alpha-L-arabinofuranosidase
VTTASLPAQVAAVTPQVVRWPGGSISDQYHWQNHTMCPSGGPGTPSGAYQANSTFDNFMTKIVIPGSYQTALTVNYGSNAACNGGGDPAEAAAWVAHAKQQGYSQYIRYWTVGNEENGGWEYDLHNPAHDPATYAAALSGASGYYQQMKAADPSAQIGAFVLGGAGYNNWDATVLSHAQYDYVEFHWYAQAPGNESDSWLLTQGPQALTSTIATLRQELQTAGKSASTPIMLGEVNSVAFNPGKQTMSIVNALFTGMLLGEVLNDNVSLVTWWFGAGGNQGCNHNNSSSLYGWQNFGGYDLVAAGAAFNWNYCTNNNGPKIVPEGAIFPSGSAYAMALQFAKPGNSMLAVSVASSLSNVRAYAASNGSGYALMLFNLSETGTATVSVSVKNAAASSLVASTVTYGKQQYDDSQNNIWSGPVSATIGTVQSSGLSVTLPAWSMTVLMLQ